MVIESALPSKFEDFAERLKIQARLILRDGWTDKRKQEAFSLLGQYRRTITEVEPTPWYHRDKFPKGRGDDERG